MKLFLDDIRDPVDNSWVVVRSYDDFVHLITSTPHIITEISFDHDLGMTPDNKTTAKSGMDAAKFFVEYAIDHPNIGEMLEKVIIHSSNPAGAENIKSYFKSAKNHGILNNNLEIIR